MTTDANTPIYHLVTPHSERGGPFDPNAGVYRRGRYHLFHIYEKRWGHVSSADMLRWQREPDAMDIPPEQAVYSGNFLETERGPTIAYHAFPYGNGFAYGDEELLHWTKDPRNPLYATEGEVEAWDPFVWRQGSEYFGIFGGLKAHLFAGHGHDTMTHVGPFIGADPWIESHEDYSCPDFFPLGDKWAFVTMSHSLGTRVYLGTWDGRSFEPATMQRMNWQGGGFLAPETLVSQDGRRILFGWILDPRGNEKEGVISLPRELFLSEEGAIGVRPIREMATLRKEELRDEPYTGVHLELELEYAPEDNPVVLAIRKSPDGREETRIVYTGQELKIESGAASLDMNTLVRKWGLVGSKFAPELTRSDRVTIQTAPLALGDENLRLRVFLDGSVIEVFANDRLAMTHRVFPTLPESDLVDFMRRPRRHRAWRLAP